MAVHSGGVLARVRRSIALIGLLIACALLPASAHEIPTDIKINVFVRPAGDMLTLLIRIPLSAMQEVDFPRRGSGLSRGLARRRGAAQRRAAVAGRQSRGLTRTACASQPRGSRRRASRCRPTVRLPPTSRRSRTCMARVSPTTSTSIGTSSCSTCCSSIRFGPTRPNSPSIPRFDRLALRVSTALRFLPPDGRHAGIRVARRPRARAARSALASGGAAFRRIRLLAHPRRHRSPAVPGVPGDPVPATAGRSSSSSPRSPSRIRSR